VRRELAGTRESLVRANVTPGGALSTMKSSAEVLCVSPNLQRLGPVLAGGAHQRRQRDDPPENHSNGNHVTQPFPMAEMEQMLVASSGIDAIGKPETGVRRYALMRGDL